MRSRLALLFLATWLAAWLTACGSDDPPVRVVIISDTHVIGPQYTTPSENSPADNESIFKTPARLRALRDQVNAMQPRPAAVFVLGDVTHAAHHSMDPAWYEANANAYTEAREIFAGFAMPVHVMMGNHDYEMGCRRETYPKALSEDLFRHFFGAEPYYAVDIGGFRFFALNGQQGFTWDPAGPKCDTEFASYGAAQLAWLDQQLADGTPAIAMSHYMGLLWQRDENPVPGQEDLAAVLANHDNVKMYLGGHSHRWLDFSDFFPYQHYVVGPARYDSDDFWTLELDDGEVRIVDRDKAIWYSTCAATYAYDAETPALVSTAAETGTCVDGF